MAPITYREAPAASGLTEAQRAWLQRQGHDERALAAWRRGELPAEQVQRMVPRGADPTLLAWGIVAGGGLLVMVAALTRGSGAGRVVFALLAALGLLGAYHLRTNPARRLGFGSVVEHRSTLRVTRGEETDDDGTRVTFSVRGVDARGEPLSFYVSEWLYERVAAGSPAEVYTLYAASRRGRPPVLCAILPEA